MNTAPESQACSVPLTNPRGLDGNPIGRGPSAPSFEMMRDELGIPRRQGEVDSNSQESTSLVWDDKSWRMWGSLLKSLATPLGRPYEVCASTAVRDASPRTTVVRRGNSRNSEWHLIHTPRGRHKSVSQKKNSLSYTCTYIYDIIECYRTCIEYSKSLLENRGGHFKRSIFNLGKFWQPQPRSSQNGGWVTEPPRPTPPNKSPYFRFRNSSNLPRFNKTIGDTKTITQHLL